MLLNQRISILYFLKSIKVDIAIIIAFSIVVGIFHQYGFFDKISVPISITAIFGTAVALLLAFRTNQAYDRWWEARIIWGAIVNDSRTLIRQSISLFDRDHQDYDLMVKDMAFRQIIWCYALGESLRTLPFSAKVVRYANAKGLDNSNIPNELLSKHSETLRKCHQNKLVNDYQQVQIDSTIARLCDSMGKCERIKNTVFPKAHCMLIHTIIYVFAAMLPFGLADRFLMVEIVLTMGIPIIFIAIEKTSVLMQDPFENQALDTPMTDLAQTIEINIKEMIGENRIPEKEDPESYYVL
ncbi:bestrophin family ion channel [uncultured Algoriphagus sp.]|uniref:bestrophin family protein n=1 Tax=uncultured Algoriphagus sp. TaxID=417365 RepID=UPI0030ED3A80|tara:strand:- start:154645 stop:155535 length:891 start_codon:yes stop_codon:yes gene_type:complete